MSRAQYEALRSQMVGAIFQLPGEDQRKVYADAAKIRAIANTDDFGMLAFSLVAVEIAIEEAE